MVSPCNLSLPMDIPWKRVCVTEDMLDTAVCDDRQPPKWQSSMAVFRYDPPDDYQEHEGYTISYLKLVVTITGFQPHDKEIEGEIDWDKLTTEDIEDVEELLGEYLPCTGAILQVSLMSPEGEKDAKLAPFFLDFEPKKRSLYEMATDTNERASRSLETLNISKSGGSTNSTEVLDVDMGGSTSFGVQGEVAGAGGGGINASESRQGQWGTKTMGAETEGAIRTTDASREKRETQSFTTQLTQLYNLFDSYHLGTNRAVFFVQPRPHVLEQPSGIVRGPRPVDGIQELFLVVARPEDQSDFCVAARLDTAHLTQIETFEHERKVDNISCSVSAAAPIRSKDLIGPDAADAKAEPDRTIDLFVGDFKSGERIYKCNSITKTRTALYQSPFSDFRIDVEQNGGYEIVHQSKGHGSHAIDLSLDDETLSITCTAKSNHCYNYGGDICLSCPAQLASYDAHAQVDVQVNLISREPTRHTGDRKVLLITTRGLCCCPNHPRRNSPVAGVVATIPVDTIVTRRGADYGLRLEDLHPAVPKPGDTPPDPRPFEGKRAEGRHDLAVANALGALITGELRERTARPRAYEKVAPYFYTDHFISRLYGRRLQRGGAAKWTKSVYAGHRDLPAGERTLDYFGKPADEVANRDIVGRSNRNLGEALGLTSIEAARLRLGALGLRFRERGDGTAK